MTAHHVRWDCATARYDRPHRSRIIAGSFVCDFDSEWLASRLAPIAVRRPVASRNRVFAVGDRASSYYYLESGDLLIHRRPHRARAVIRRVSEGELFIYECDGSHVAHCDAIVDSYLLSIDRARFEQQARFDPALKGILHAIHAGELALILQCLPPVSDSQTPNLRTPIRAIGVPSEPS